MHSCFAFDKKRRTKRVLSLALALALVFSAVAFLPQTVNAATTGTVTASALNVRSGPGTNYASLGLLRRGGRGISSGRALRRDGGDGRRRGQAGETREGRGQTQERAEGLLFGSSGKTNGY